MTLYLRKVKKSNWKEIVSLSVSKEQRGFIETNAYSILESVFEQGWTSIGLYDNEIPVGYAMYGDQTGKKIWIDRFMIDYNHQGKNYGKRFLKLIIEELTTYYAVDTILLSVVPANDAAKQFYKKFGFVDTKQTDESGEKIYCMEVNKC